MSSQLSEKKLKNLLSKELKFKDTGISVESGNVNPTVTLVEAKKGSLFLSSLDGKLYQKQTDDLDLNWIEIEAGSGGGSSAVTSVNSQIGDVVLTKSDLSLGNVDNTSDLNKPISTSTQTALNLKQNSLGFTPENLANKGATNGYAPLVSGLVPSVNLPTFVADTITDGVLDVAPSQNAVFDALELKANLTGATFSGAISASNLSGTNTGDQDLSTYAPLASPSLTGTPTAPTATSGTNTTQVATTAFVTSAVSGIGSGANTTLSNLGTTSINADLLPVSGSINIGNFTGKYFNQVVTNTVWDSTGGISVNLSTGSLDHSGSQTAKWNTSGLIINANSLSAPRALKLGLDVYNTTYYNIKAPSGLGGGLDYLFQLPSTMGTSGQTLTTDGAGVLSWTTPSGGANTTLSNLGTTAINADLLSATDNTINIGSSANYFANTYSKLITTNGSINPDAISASSPRDIGNLFAFTRIRASRFSPDLVTYTFTGDFSSGTSTITNVSPAIPAWLNSGNYTVYASGFTTRTNGSSSDGSVTTLNSFTGTTITMSNTSLASGTTVSFSVVPFVVLRTENQTTKQSAYTQVNSGNTTTAESGHLLLYTGSSTTGRTGDTIVTTGISSSGGTTGNVVVSTGTTSGTRGKIRFVNGTEGTAGHVWTSTDTSGGGQWSALASSGANTTLSNLTSPTSINQHLVSATHSAFNIGEGAGGGGKSFNTVFAYTFGKNLGSDARLEFGTDRSVKLVDGQAGTIFSTPDANIGVDLLFGRTNSLTARIFKFQSGNLSAGDNFIGLKAPLSLATSPVYTLPVDGTSGQRLTTNGSGVLSFSNKTIIESGSTASRPASPVTGETFLDLTLNIPIWYNGTNWINAVGVTV